jgi:hypothetical protein
MKNVSDGVRGYLFHGRFGSCVLDERHLLAAARYVELNPINAGMVKEAMDYPGPVRGFIRCAKRDVHLAAHHEN